MARTARGATGAGATEGDTAPEPTPETAPTPEAPPAPEAAAPAPEPPAPAPVTAPEESRSVPGGSVFQDSAVYDNFWMTHQVRQFDRAPLTAESIISAVAGGSCAAAYAEHLSDVAAYAKGVATPSTVRAGLTNHHDAYVNFFDSTSIKRNYTG
jgi:hypothetical protein